MVHKPAGMNTHAPAPFAGEGVHEWLKHSAPRFSRLAIIHRLDKETSGVMVFGNSPNANRSLGQQFTEHSIKKRYCLITDRKVPFEQKKVVSALVRVGDKYASRPPHAGAEIAETHFRALSTQNGMTVVEARPVTGRTHQIRSHAAAEGFPILGDTLYGGTKAARVFLHAAELRLKHPATQEEMVFACEPDFEANARIQLRLLLVDQNQTNAFRIIHGAADGWPGWYVDKLGDHLLSQSEKSFTAEQKVELQRLMEKPGARGVHHKFLSRHVRGAAPEDVSPRPVLGEAQQGPVTIRENGIAYELGFDEGYSVGLFLDQRENRRRLLDNYIAAGLPLFPAGPQGAEVLNAFAYTCGFSVCAAKAGARTTSLDLSRKYLDWGRRNFALNGLDAAAHDFIYGDAFDWLRQLDKKGRRFDLVILDPPTFSQSKEAGVFRAEKDYGRLAAAALPLVKPGGFMLASTNAARLEPEKFLETLEVSVKAAGRKIIQQHYVPQPCDFPIHKEEPAYLKTVWVKIK